MGKKETKMAGFVSFMALTLLFVIPRIAQTQDFPNKAVTLVIPYGAGGSHDLTARALAGVSLTHLGQPLVIQLKPGAGGAIASDFVANAPPDGYTLLFGATQPNSTIPAVEGRSKGPNDLASVSRINYSPFVTNVQFNAPYKNLKEMFDWCKANPGKMRAGSLGPWSATDFFWKEANKEFGITYRAIPHEGGGPAMIALLGGHIDTTCSLASVFLEYVAAKKIRPIAVLDERRIKDLPDVPTAKEQGFGSVHVMWRGILAPKNTPRTVIDKLATAFMKMSNDKTVVSIIEKMGDEINYLGPDEFSRVWRAEYEHLKEIGKLLK